MKKEMKKATILAILMIVLLATTVSTALPTQHVKKSEGASLQPKPVDPQPLLDTSLIFGYVRDKDTNAPIVGAHVLFRKGLAFGYGTTNSEGLYGFQTLILRYNCTGIAWKNGYWPSTVYVYIYPGHSNYVEFHLKHL
jgi:hypothetical protein